MKVFSGVWMNKLSSTGLTLVEKNMHMLSTLLPYRLQSEQGNLIILIR